MTAGEALNFHECNLTPKGVKSPYQLHLINHDRSFTFFSSRCEHPVESPIVQLHPVISLQQQLGTRTLSQVENYFSETTFHTSNRSVRTKWWN